MRGFRGHAKPKIFQELRRMIHVRPEKARLSIGRKPRSIASPMRDSRDNEVLKRAALQSKGARFTACAGAGGSAAPHARIPQKKSQAFLCPSDWLESPSRFGRLRSGPCRDIGQSPTSPPPPRADGLDAAVKNSFRVVLVPTSRNLAYGHSFRNRNAPTSHACMVRADVPGGKNRGFRRLRSR
jgi:hypothetical protein